MSLNRIRTLRLVLMLLAAVFLGLSSAAVFSAAGAITANLYQQDYADSLNVVAEDMTTVVEETTAVYTDTTSVTETETDVGEQEECSETEPTTAVTNTAESSAYAEEPEQYKVVRILTLDGTSFRLPASILSVLALSFTALFLILFPRSKAGPGPDGAVLILSGAVFLLLLGYFPRNLYFGLFSVRMLPTPILMRGILQNVFTVLMLSLYAFLILYALKELLSWFSAKADCEWILLRRLLRRRTKNGEKPQRAVIPAVFLLSLEVVLLVLFIVCKFYWHFNYSLPVSTDLPYYLRLFLSVSAILLLILFTILTLRAGLRDMTAVRDAAVEKAVQNERLRVELIANVSHDLRTPLTSIIGYGNLLEQEDLSETGSENLNLLNQKAGYMKELVDSLFELTKVSSGVLAPNMTELDLIRLLEQAVGLLEDDLKAAGLTIRRHYCRDSFPIETDGNFMSRVFMNLLQNAVKYALSGTRIHITLTEEDSAAQVRITNVASYEMDFDPSEITERFTRGDHARTEKGSGLGLAIAKTYTEAVGGTFLVEIDGDVFAAVVKLPCDSPKSRKH